MKIRLQRGQLAFPLTLFISLIVSILGFFTYEICEYSLARQQLQTVVQASALACETSLASSGATPAGLNNALAAATQIFQLNSILGHPLTGAILLPSGEALTLAAGQSAVSFQLLDPMTHAPLATSQVGTLSGAVVEATGMYAYLPSFSSLVGISFLPVQMQASVTSGVQQLDLVVAMDISGGMDDDTPVTLLQRYWDYDNNFPPNHIVYMIPAPQPNSGQSAQGLLGELMCYQAPLVNALPPQGLEYGVLPPSAPPNCPQLFSELGGAPTKPLRGAGTTDNGNPPGNFVAAYSGAASPPNMATQNGVALSNAKSAIAAGVQQVDAALYQCYCVGPTGFASWEDQFNIPLVGYTPTGRCPNIMTAFIALSNTLANAAQQNITDTQLIEACNAGNAATFPQISFSVNSAASMQQGWVNVEALKPAAPPMNVPSAGGGPPSGYVRYGMQFATGSTPSSQNEVIVPTGTPGPSASYAPTVSWGPTNPNTFTDLVVNLDGQTAFNQFSSGAFTFPSVGALVEAARGNLETDAAAQGAGLDLNALGVTPQAGYQAAYQKAAVSQVQPLQSIVNALPTFLSLVTKVGQTNLGFTAFSYDAGTTANQTFTAPIVSNTYTSGGTGTFPLPGIQLGANNLSIITGELPGLRAHGLRNVAKAIQAALKQFKSGGRSGSQKAIVLITDGPPNQDLVATPTSWTNSSANALSDARTEAALAKSQGVAIFCISIYSDANTQAAEQAIYNDTNRDSASGGISAIAGNGGRFYQVAYTDANGTQSALTNAFGNVARQLVSLMHQ